MASLREFMLKKGFKRIKLRYTETDHFEVKAFINDVEGRFILDTGASSTCVDFSRVKFFKLFARESEVKAAGAGATNMMTHVSENNKLSLGDWLEPDADIVVFDLSHVNEALLNHKATEVDGIIGADILKEGKAVIDYKQKALYLK
ncbi:retropepsin-like aspartic protease [Mesohalobacter halotolerans]|uniref:Acid protease n=1 Tax=Mesohalobacter halotolerans TaxID=1883405 RepID=A0A4U5TUJ1_9FLAO|nr:retropepsin-like aspartic protease [Mesohalobacter halotolerans]MBS3738898.1 clan AA aspartic protease [Psychroflexus sp.]TKS56968.1 acid protease [Mesohalobacter halotolerans]